jgi:hypothetical protein
MRKFLTLITLLIVTGCELAPLTPDQLATMHANIPKCSDQRQCEAMWSAARNWVTSSCGMKIQTITDSFIETYGPIGALTAACRVTKDPEPTGGYSFHVAVSCEGGSCARTQTVNLVAGFQSSVRTAGDAFKAHS